jgi:hypothetical protein
VFTHPRLPSPEVSEKPVLFSGFLPPVWPGKQAHEPFQKLHRFWVSSIMRLQRANDSRHAHRSEWLGAGKLSNHERPFMAWTKPCPRQGFFLLGFRECEPHPAPVNLFYSGRHWLWRSPFSFPRLAPPKTGPTSSPPDRRRGGPRSECLPSCVALCHQCWPTVHVPTLSPWRNPLMCALSLACPLNKQGR